MKYYDEEHVLIPKGEHIVFLPDGYKTIGYEKMEKIDYDKIRKAKRKLADYNEDTPMSVYVNSVSVIVDNRNIIRNVPGIPFETYERMQDEYVYIEPLKHEVCLPYLRIISPNEVSEYSYEGYEPISFEFELDEAQGLWDSGYSDEIVKYKMYVNTETVALKRKELGKNILGKKTKDGLKKVKIYVKSK